MKHRGILTSGDREFLESIVDVDELDEEQDKKLRNIRYKLRQRFENAKADLELLDRAGQDDMVDKFHSTVGRVPQLAEEVQRLREQLEGEK